jgi:hypothetical protein
LEFAGFVNPERAISPTPCDVRQPIRRKIARVILTDTAIYSDQPAVLTQPVVYMGGIAPAFLGVVNVHRASQHEEVFGVDDHAVPSRQFHLLGEGSRLRIPAIQGEDFDF